MKKNKIVISALALLIGTGLAGSVSGTIAWYQYSTRASAKYVGLSGGTNGNLQMRIKGKEAWVSRLTKQDIAAYLADNHLGENLQPITSGNMAKNDALPEFFYRNPIPYKASYDNWEKADNKNYVALPLELRFVERKNGQETNIAKDVYLSDLLIQEDSNNAGEDLSDAIRFHISSYSSANPNQRTNRLISKNGGAIDVHGQLDLDADPGNDKAYSGDAYGFDGGTLDFVDYGASNEQPAPKQESYAAKVDSNDATPILVQTADDSLELSKTEGRSIGTTVEGDTALLNVNITIWIEGWQKFDNNAIWSTDYINAQFDVGFELAVDAE